MLLFNSSLKKNNSISAYIVVILALIGCCHDNSIFVKAASKRASNKNKLSLDTLNYNVYPKLSPENSAVIEWGHSAIISALDASVALFGPQTSQAALLEVECKPILASPLNGIPDKKKKTNKTEQKDDEPDDTTEEEESTNPTKLTKLDNADDVHGNMVVMTNTGDLTGVDMAKLAKNSGAVALLIVNVDQDHPDEIYPLSVDDDEPDFDTDIPVVMISLNSANVLTTATVTEGMDEADIVNHGMPERVRLYAGGDRPFFEDVIQESPTLYLIHNLLTEEECDTLIGDAKNKVSPLDNDNTDILQLLPDASQVKNVDRAMLWTGGLKAHASKQIDERTEQVTGFPIDHFSDWIVERYSKDSYWGPHYDYNSGSSHDSHLYQIMATVTIFLSDYGPSVVYPSSASQPLDGKDKTDTGTTEPIKIIPRKGVAVVHHNIEGNDDPQQQTQQFDISTIHAFLSPKSNEEEEEEYGYIARKHIFLQPISRTRRFVLPALALPFGGKLPTMIVSLHDLIINQFGYEDGSIYFDKIIMFICALNLLLIVQLITNIVKKYVFPPPSTTSTSSSNSKKSSSSSKSDGSNKTSSKTTTTGKKSKKTKSS